MRFRSAASLAVAVVSLFGLGFAAGGDQPRRARAPVPVVSTPQTIAAARPSVARARHAPLRFQPSARGFTARMRGLRAELVDSSLALRGGEAAHARTLAHIQTWFDGAAPASAQLDAAGAVVLARGAAAERFAPTPGGIEHTLTFESRPRAGDLDVHVAVSGARCLGVDGRGARLSRGLRYGRGTLVDAAGVRTDVPPRCEPGGVALTLPGDVLRSAAYPVVLDPTISTDTEIDMGAEGPPDDPEDVVIASDGAGTHMVAWSDGLDLNNPHLFAGWFHDDGTLITPEVPLGSATQAHVDELALAFSGQYFLSYWSFDDAHTISGQAFDSTGAPVGAPSSIDVFNLQIDGGPSVSCSPSECVLLFSTYDTSSNKPQGVLLYRTDPAGALLSPDPIVFGQPQVGDSIAFDGSNFVVVGHEDFGMGNIVTWRVAPDGTLVDATPTVVVSGAGDPPLEDGIACIGSTCLVAYEQTPSFTNWQFSYQLLQSGALVGSAAVALTDTNGSNDHRRTDLASNGSSYLLTAIPFNNLNDCATQIVSSTGQLVGAHASIPMPLNTATAIVGAPSPLGYQLAWGQGPNDGLSGTGDGLFAMHVAPSGSLVESTPTPLLFGHNREQRPSIAFDGANYLVVWADDRTGYSNVWGARVGPAGAPIDATPFAVSPVAAAQTEPSVAFDGTNFVIAWRDERGGAVGDIYAARVSPAGQVIDAQAIPIDTGAEDSHPFVAPRPNGSIIIWADVAFGLSRENGALLDTNGVTQPPVQLFSATVIDEEFQASVAWAGGAYVLAYSSDKVHVERYDANLNALGSGTINAPVINSVAVGLACHSSTCTLAWPSQQGAIHAANVLANGTISPANGAVIVASTNEQDAVTVAFDGTRDVLAWAGNNGDLSMTLVDADTLAPLLAQPVSKQPTAPAAWPGAATDGAHNVLLAYEGNRVIEDVVIFDDGMLTTASSSGSGGAGGASSVGSGPSSSGSTSSFSTGSSSSTANGGSSAATTPPPAGPSGAGGAGGDGSNGGDSSSGCSCETAGGGGANSSAFAASVLLAVAVAARRRRPARRDSHCENGRPPNRVPRHGGRAEHATCPDALAGCFAVVAGSKGGGIPAEAGASTSAIPAPCARDVRT